MQCVVGWGAYFLVDDMIDRSLRSAKTFKRHNEANEASKHVIHTQHDDNI